MTTPASVIWPTLMVVDVAASVVVAAFQGDFEAMTVQGAFFALVFGIGGLIVWQLREGNKKLEGHAENLGKQAVATAENTTVMKLLADNIRELCSSVVQHNKEQMRAIREVIDEQAQRTEVAMAEIRTEFKSLHELLLRKAT